LVAGGVILATATALFLARSPTVGQADAGTGDHARTVVREGPVPAGPPVPASTGGPQATVGTTPGGSSGPAPTGPPGQTTPPGQTVPPPSPVSTPSPTPTSASRTVPDVVGDDEETARLRLKAVGLMASVTYSTSRFCVVLQQNPAAGTTVKIDSTINLIIGKQPPGQCLSPA